MNLPKIVFLVGGNGSHVTHPFQGFRVTLGNPSADSGGSAGILSEEHHTVPTGDLRRSAINGVPPSRRRLDKDLFEYRFEEGGLAGHTVGNIVITALIKMCNGDINAAMDRLGNFVGVSQHWKVRPATTTAVSLHAKLTDGTVLHSEGEIDRPDMHPRQSDAKIAEVWIEPRDVPGNPDLVGAILDADLIVMGPTDHVTSLLPILLVRDVAEALGRTTAKRVYVANLMTKPNETSGYTLASYIRDIHRYAGNIIDFVIVNNGKIPQDLKVRYAKGGQYLVHASGEEEFWDRPKIVEADLLMRDEDSGRIRHDPFHLMATLMAIYPPLRKFV